MRVINECHLTLIITLSLKIAPFLRHKKLCTLRYQTTRTARNTARDFMKTTAQCIIIVHSICNILYIPRLKPMIRTLCIYTALFKIRKKQNSLSWALV